MGIHPLPDDLSIEQVTSEFAENLLDHWFEVNPNQRGRFYGEIRWSGQLHAVTETRENPHARVLWKWALGIGAAIFVALVVASYLGVDLWLRSH